MKTFTFRLDRALQWRATQVALQQTKTAAAAGRLAGIEGAIETRKAAIRVSAGQIAQSATGTDLSSYAAFASASQLYIRTLDNQAVEARKSLGIGMNALKEANRRMQLLENLKESRQTRWQKDFDRETAAIADEAFLASKFSRRRRSGIAGPLSFQSRDREGAVCGGL